MNNCAVHLKLTFINQLYVNTIQYNTIQYNTMRKRIKYSQETRGGALMLYDDTGSPTGRRLPLPSWQELNQ